MRRPRCGTCRHWINDEGGAPFCSLVPPAPVPPDAQDNPRSSHPIVPNWAGCAQHERHVGRSLKAAWHRVTGKPGNDPERMRRAAEAVK